MIVDSAHVTRKALAEDLASWGMRCDALESGARAFRHLHAAVDEGDPYRFVLLSSNLGGMRPETFGALVKGDPKLESIDLVYLAAVGEQGQGKRLSEVGFAGYLVKPFDEDSLQDLLAVVEGGRESDRDVGLVTRHTLADSSILPAPKLEGRASSRRPGPPRPESPSPAKAADPAKAPTDSPRVLVVDDNPVNRKVGRLMLEKLGCRVDTAASGEEALALRGRNDYALILLDLRMPGLDGLETAARLRGLERGREVRIPIVAMTASAHDDERERCLAAGMDDFVRKPVPRDEMRRVVARWAGVETGRVG
jgi:CheY-like chemotaxis protein